MRHLLHICEGSSCNAHTCHVLQAARTPRRFTENASNDAMKAVMLGWSEEDIKILGNNTLMLNYHTHAWNKTIQGKQAVQSGKRL